MKSLNKFYLKIRKNIYFFAAEKLKIRKGLFSGLSTAWGIFISIKMVGALGREYNVSGV
jgi:hypothetical protein